MDCNKPEIWIIATLKAGQALNRLAGFSGSPQFNLKALEGIAPYLHHFYRFKSPFPLKRNSFATRFRIDDKF
jgi:hypothetical protein